MLPGEWTTPALSIADCVAGQWSVTPSGPDWSHALSCSGRLYKTWRTPADSKSPQESNKVTAGARHPDVRVWSATNLQSGPEPLSFSVSYKPGEMHCHRCGTAEKMKVLWELHTKIPVQVHLANKEMTLTQLVREFSGWVFTLEHIHYETMQASLLLWSVLAFQKGKGHRAIWRPPLSVTE